MNFKKRVHKKIVVALSCCFLMACNSGNELVNPQSEASLNQSDLVSVPELDDVISSIGPLTAAELYMLDSTDIEKDFSVNNDPEAKEELRYIHDTAARISENEKAKLLEHVTKQTLAVSEQYTYLYCYATAWVNTEDGVKAPLWGSLQTNYHLAAFADSRAVPVQVPAHPYLLPTTFGMTYFTTKDSIASLSERCKVKLTAMASDLLKRNYPNYGIKDVSIENITVRGRNNELAADHPFLPLNGSVGDNKIHTIVSFGDSLSDTDSTSNMLLHIMPNRHTWFAGHFSNGWTWPEYAGSKLNIIPYNEAWGAAGVNTQPVLNLAPWAINFSYASGFVFPSIYDQNASYNNYVELNAPRNSDETVYTLLIGGNDFVNYNEDSLTVLNKVAATLNYLISINHAKNIVLLNLPDLTVAPIFKRSKAAIKVAVGEKTLAYNAGLSNVVNVLQASYPNVKLKIFNTKGLFDQIMKNPLSYGLVNVQDTCLVDPDHTYALRAKRRSGCNGYNYMFWDELHPTTVMHKILGESVADFIQENY